MKDTERSKASRNINKNLESFLQIRFIQEEDPSSHNCKAMHTSSRSPLD